VDGVAEHCVSRAEQSRAEIGRWEEEGGVCSEIVSLLLLVCGPKLVCAARDLFSIEYRMDVNADRGVKARCARRKSRYMKENAM
jgi:hypothetical protein